MGWLDIIIRARPAMAHQRFPSTPRIVPMSTSIFSSRVIECPVCAGTLEPPSDVMVGELLDCPDCGCELEVRAVEPALQVVEAPTAAEDWGE